MTATNRDLEGMVQSGQFREDLLYRLRAHAILLPPLRHHREDIVPIAVYHMEKICHRSGLSPKTFSPDFIEALLSYPWPGNVRELVNAVERSVAAASSASMLFKKHLPGEIRVNLARASSNPDGGIDQMPEQPPYVNLPTIKDLRASVYNRAEKEYFTELMKVTAGGIDKACIISGLNRPRLYELLRKHGIRPKD